MYFSYFYHFYLLSCNNDVIQPTGCKAIKTTPSNYIIWPKSNNVVFLSDLFSCFFFFQMAEKQVRVLFHGNGCLLGSRHLSVQSKLITSLIELKWTETKTIIT